MKKMMMYLMVIIVITMVVGGCATIGVDFSEPGSWTEKDVLRVANSCGDGMEEFQLVRTKTYGRRDTIHTLREINTNITYLGVLVRCGSDISHCEDYLDMRLRMAIAVEYGGKATISCSSVSMENWFKKGNIYYSYGVMPLDDIIVNGEPIELTKFTRK